MHYWSIWLTNQVGIKFAIDVSQTNQDEVNRVWIITKYALTAALVVLVSEVAKRSDKLGVFVAALPLITILTLKWFYLENQPQQKISSHAWYTLWYVIVTLPMLLANLSYKCDHDSDLLRSIRNFCSSNRRRVAIKSSVQSLIDRL